MRRFAFHSGSGAQHLGALVLTVSLASSAAVAGNYKVEFSGKASTIAGEAPPFSCEVKIVHDAFFGEPTVKAIAKACTRADGSLLKSPPVYACYDVMQGSVRRSTRCVGPLIEFDVSGSPNWGVLFPGLSASEAKALVKAGFTIANVRLSGKPLKADAAGSSVAAAPWTEASTGPDGASATDEAPAPGATSAESSGTVSSTCTPPGLRGDSGPWPACLTPTIGTTNLAVLTTDGKRHGLHAVETEIEWRLPGALDWRATRDSGLVARPSLAAGPCRSWEVRARTRCDDGTVSQWAPTLRMTTSCPAPSNLRAEPSGPGAVMLSWHHHVGLCSDVTGTTTEVELAEANGAWGQVVPSAERRIEGLTPGRSYSVRVRFAYPGGAASRWEATSFRSR